VTVRPEVGRIRLSTIGRSIDLQVPTNRAIALLALGVFVAGSAVGLVHGETWATSLLDGLSWAGSAFLAWALGRETDPDRWYSAFFAAAGALACAIWLGPPSFGLLFWFMLGLRFVNRSTGRAPGILDIFAFYGLSLWLGFSIHWAIPLLATVSVPFAGGGRFPRVLGIGLVLPCCAIALGATRGWQFAPPAGGWVETVGLAFVTSLLTPVGIGYRSPRSIGDHTGAPLDRRRVRWALAWSAGSALVLDAIGAVAFIALAPVWAAFAGTFVGWTIDRIAKTLAPPS
jgi:hypothetical protein